MRWRNKILNQTRKFGSDDGVLWKSSCAYGELAAEIQSVGAPERNKLHGCCGVETSEDYMWNNHGRHCE